MTRILRAAAQNLAVLLAVAVPMGILAAWIEGLIYPPEWMRGVTEAATASGAASTFLFWYLVLVVPVFIGGCLHQVVLRFVPMPHNASMSRGTVLLTTPVVLLGFLLIGNSITDLMTPRAIVPFGVALLAYGMLACRLNNSAVGPHERGD